MKKYYEKKKTIQYKEQKKVVIPYMRFYREKFAELYKTCKSVTEACKALDDEDKKKYKEIYHENKKKYQI